MKDCSRYEAQINQYLDGMLSREEEEALFAHLQHCPACRQLMEDLDFLSHQFDLLEVSPPESLSHAVSSKVECRGGRRRSVPVRKTMWSVAAVLCAAFLGIGAFWTARNHVQTAASQGADQTLQAGGASGGAESVLESPAEQRKTNASVPEDSASNPADAPPDAAHAEESVNGYQMGGGWSLFQEAAEAADSDGSQAGQGEAAAGEPAGVPASSQTAAYFAVVTVSGQGESRVVEEEDLSSLLEELKEAGISYTCRTSGEEIDPDSAYALVSYLSD